MHNLTILAAAVLVGCNTGPAAAPVGAGPGVANATATNGAPVPLDTSMTQGHDESDHVEVAPGVFLRKDLWATGRYQVLDQNGEIAALTSGGGSSTATTTDTGGSTGTLACFLGDSDSYYDYEDQLFDVSSNWSIFAAAYSLDYNGEVTHTISTHSSAYTVYPGLEGLGASQYVYLNDEYIGFTRQDVANDTLAMAGMYLSVPCDDGYLDLMTLNTAYARDGENAIEIDKKNSAYLVCCPDPDDDDNGGDDDDDDND